MNLETYIEEVIKQIVSGSQKGDAEIKKISTRRGTKVIMSTAKVDFDIAVSTIEEQSAGGKGAIKVASFFNLEGGGGTKDIQSNVSRIKFSLTIKLASDGDTIMHS